MGISITTPAPTVSLTTILRVASELGTLSAEDEVLIDSLIREASAAVANWCNQTFEREALTETLPGYGDIQLQLARTPVVAVSAVTLYGAVITDYAIENAARGWLTSRSLGSGGATYQRTAWPWSVDSYSGLSGDGAYLNFGTPMARQEEPVISVDYTAGYILPGQAIRNSTTLSAASADNSFNDSAGRFPTLLKSGDRVEVSGFTTNTGNNGRFVLTGTPTASKIKVTATLVNESPASATVLFPAPTGLPSDLEKATVEAVKSWFSARKDDSRIVEKHAGPVGLRYAEGVGAAALPPVCVGLLSQYRRAA